MYFNKFYTFLLLFVFLIVSFLAFLVCFFVKIVLFPSKTCMHAYTQIPTYPLPHTDTHTTGHPGSNRLQCIHRDRWEAIHCIMSPFIIESVQSHQESCGCSCVTYSQQWLYFSYMSSSSCIWGVEMSRGQQRWGSLNLTQVIWALLEIGQRPVWEVFLPSAQGCVIGVYHVLHNAVCSVSYKRYRLESGPKCRSCGGKWSLVTGTEILAHFVEAVIKVCYYSHIVLKGTGKENVREHFF